MGIRITGRRFFGGFLPDKSDIMGKESCYKIVSYPKNTKPYSWSYVARKGQEFNWKATL